MWIFIAFLSMHFVLAESVTSIDLPVGGTYDLAINYINNKTYVSTNDDLVLVVDGNTNKVVANATAGLVNGVAVNPLTGKVYVSEARSSKILVMDGKTDLIVDNISSLGYTPDDIIVDPTKGDVYAVSLLADSVINIDGDTNQINERIHVGETPARIAVNPDKGKIYVSNYGTNTVSVIDTVSSKVVANVTVGDLC